MIRIITFGPYYCLLDVINVSRFLIYRLNVRMFPGWSPNKVYGGGANSVEGDNPTQKNAVSPKALTQLALTDTFCLFARHYYPPWQNLGEHRKIHTAEKSEKSGEKAKMAERPKCEKRGKGKSGFPAATKNDTKGTNANNSQEDFIFWYSTWKITYLREVSQFLSISTQSFLSFFWNFS